MDTSIVVETFNTMEGTSLDSLRQALRAATSFQLPNGEVEVLLADVTRDPAIRRLLEQEFPEIRRIDGVGLGYCGAKRRAAQGARGRYVVYLDCDCVPEPGWWEHITAPLRDGTAVATAGFAHYPGGFFEKIQSLLDFGFLIPHCNRPLGCYPSNNSGFTREVLLALPEPEGPMRCTCYAHAQLLARLGMAPQLVAGAAVRHEAPPMLRERLRQGYDMVAACWVDPQLPDADWLRLGLFAAPLYYARRVWLDLNTLFMHRSETGLGRIAAIAAVPLIPLLRLVDGLGIVAALFWGTAARRWVDPGAEPHALSR